MATQLLTGIIAGARFLPTSSIPTICIQTDSSKLEVALSCVDGLDEEPETFFSTTLYAYNNVVELEDVGLLIEEYFRRRGKVADTIDFIFGDLSVSGHFLYCENRLPVGEDVSSQLFLSCRAQIVHKDSIVTFASAALEKEAPFIIRAVGHCADSEYISTVQWSVSDVRYQNLSRFFSVAEIISRALAECEGNEAPTLRDVMYFSIECGDLQKMCYIVPAPAYNRFTFRNMFNVLEYIDIIGTITSKTEVSRNSFAVTGCTLQYDRQVSRTYEVQTAPLTLDEVSLFEQFLASHEVKLILAEEEAPVIITDQSCEPDTDDSTLTTIKFTWRFSENRPYRVEIGIDDIHDSARKVFDDTFSPEYE